MKKKIIGILVCSMLIIMALPAVANLNAYKKLSVEKENAFSTFEELPDECGVCNTHVFGNDTALDGATVRYYNGPFFWPWDFTQYDLEYVSEGEYYHLFRGCGIYKAVAMPVLQGYGSTSQIFVLAGNNEIDIYLTAYKGRVRSHQFQFSPLLSQILEKFFAIFTFFEPVY